MRWSLHCLSAFSPFPTGYGDLYFTMPTAYVFIAFRLLVRFQLRPRRKGRGVK